MWSLRCYVSLLTRYISLLIRCSKLFLVTSCYFLLILVIYLIYVLAWTWTVTLRIEIYNVGFLRCYFIYWNNRKNNLIKSTSKTSNRHSKDGDLLGQNYFLQSAGIKARKFKNTGHLSWRLSWKYLQMWQKLMSNKSKGMKQESFFNNQFIRNINMKMSSDRLQ